MSEYLLAEFGTAHETAQAAKHATDAGKPAQDALTPNPVEGIAEHLAPSTGRSPIGWVMVILGAFGAAIGYAMQWYSAVIDYPINSGGRPLNSWPAFMLVPYETAILSAGVLGTLAFLRMCRLPRLHHPLFEADVVRLASQDRYLLVFPREAELSNWIGAELRPRAIHEIRQ